MLRGSGDGVGNEAFGRGKGFSKAQAAAQGHVLAFVFPMAGGAVTKPGARPLGVKPRGAPEHRSRGEYQAPILGGLAKKEKGG